MRKSLFAICLLCSSVLIGCDEDTAIVVNPGVDCRDFCEGDEMCVDGACMCGDNVCSGDEICVSGVCSCGGDLCDSGESCVDNVCQKPDECADGGCEISDEPIPCGGTCLEFEQCVEDVCLCGDSVCSDNQICTGNGCEDIIEDEPTVDDDPVCDISCDDGMRRWRMC